MATNDQARFTIDGSPSEDPVTGDRLFIAINGQTLDVTLEANPSTALSATFEVFDANDTNSPKASKGAPLLTWTENGLPAILLGPVPIGINEIVHIDMPASGILSYLIRCTVSTPGDGSPNSQVQVYERLVLVFSTATVPPIRKTIPGESTEARVRAWSDAINDMVDAIQGLTIGGAAATLVSGPGQYTVPMACVVSDLVYITGANAASKADNTGVATMPCMGIIVDKPTPTTATIAYAGMIGGLAGMTPGAMQFVGAAGARIEAGALPSAPGSVIQQIGVAETAISLIFQPRQVVVL